MPLRLSAALTRNARTRPIHAGEVTPAGIDLLVTPLPAAEMFWRQLKFAEFDVSEMSLSSLAIATSQAPTAWVALPIFTTRIFFHTDLIVRSDAGITSPADLRGKRLGVPEYQQTRAVWVRDALLHGFGVHASEIRWFMERSVERSHGGATSFSAPPGIDLTYVAPDRDLGTMLLSGELDAAVTHFSDRNLVDRALVDLRGRSEVRRLFADPVAEGRRFYAATGIYPINHCVVIRRELAAREPWVAGALYAAFRAAKERGTQRARALLGPALETATIAGAALAVDPMPYGVIGARRVLDALVAALSEQGLTQRPVALDELFLPAALGW